MPVGFDAKLYLNTGSYASPTWVEITEARDVSAPLDVNEVDNSDRGSKFKKYDAGQLDLSLTFNMTYRNGNTNFATLQTAVLGRSSLEFAVMDGAIATSGSEGWRMTCVVLSQGLQQPLADGQTVDVSAKPTYDATAGDPRVVHGSLVWESRSGPVDRFAPSSSTGSIA